MTTIEKLKQQAKELAEKNAVKVAEAAEIAKLKATIALESNEALLEAKARLQVASDNSDRLKSLIQECEAIIAATPILNKKTRTNRKWQGSHRYGYGNQIDHVYELCTGIMYSCEEHRAMMLAHTGLSMGLISELVDAFGQPAYYSNNNHVFIDAVPANLDKMLDSLNIVQSQLSVIIDTSKLTKDNVELEFVRAENRARQQEELAIEAMKELQIEL